MLQDECKIYTHVMLPWCRSITSLWYRTIKANRPMHDGHEMSNRSILGHILVSIFLYTDVLHNDLSLYYRMISI